jgi:bifunctional UDP-N-acetylglucosamine pyrophosphorylase/glucosamine-1-phosphate N-acetyltransferase
MDQAVILAAGESSRCWPLNNRHKSLFYLMGKPIIFWNLKGIEEAGIKKVIIVQSPKKDVEEELKNFKFKSLKIDYIIQPKPLSTGDALWQARNHLKGYFFVLNADVLNSKEILMEMKKKIKKEKTPVLAGQKTKTPWLFGMMKIKGDRILQIVEKPKIGKEPSQIKAVGVYYLEPSFFSFYQRVKKGPYDLQEALSEYMKKRKVKLSLLKKPEEETPSFLKYPWHLFNLSKYLFDNFLKEKIEKSAKISKNVIIEGKVYVGENTKILTGAIIKGPCYIGENCFIGNYTLIENYSNLENQVKIGNFSEITHSIFQANSILHSGFVADSIIGKNVKIGAEIITSNMRLDEKEIFCMVKKEKVNTGLKNFGTVIGENTLIGTRVNIMPGKFIGSNCFISPNSLIKENIKDYTHFK